MTRFGLLARDEGRAQAEDIPSASWRRQHAGKDCQAQMGLVGQPIGAALDNPDREPGAACDYISPSAHDRNSRKRFLSVGLSFITRAFGSPKTPCRFGRKSGSNTRPSRRFRLLNFKPRRNATNLGNARLSGIFQTKIAHSIPRRPRFVLDRSSSRVTAERFIKRIKARCDKIGILPHGGRPRDDLERGLRTVAFERRAVIAYRVVSDHVRIVNIF
jgi:toxin ParE1/3/4